MAESDTYKYILRIHGDDYTVDHPHSKEENAVAHAKDLLLFGVRVGNRIYPNRSIVCMEILTKEEA